MKLNKKQIKEFKTIFISLDKDKDGKITKKQLNSVIKKIGKDPTTGREIFLKIGRYGRYLEMQNDDQKPKRIISMDQESSKLISSHSYSRSDNNAELIMLI